MQLIGTFGKAIGINLDALVLMDGTKKVVSSDVSVVGGSPLALALVDNETYIVSYKYLADNSLTTNVKPYGLAVFIKNQYENETYSLTGLYGSGKGTVAVMGRMTLGVNTFVVSNNTVKLFAFDTTLTYEPGDDLYVNLSAGNSFGLITNVLVESGAGQNDMTKFGKVIAYYPHAITPSLEVMLG
jgi:hypothetical protein